ncbi:ATP-dependent helicase [Leucobacter komagatae]|uniref:DNA 3'-5' helicase n=1 Tax=Leucobacter komagatae TaxID=55969 RepID=A0A0D0I218_9MICO|nr:ATP-dependent helicase [Leucobacter komagatae]KIP53776.1 ATP-dependent DNA helicase [Leucobacter komagatae]
MTADAAEILQALDPDQREIAQALRGPVSVLAGAGTGKTRAITHRIAYGVRMGVYDPQRVLAVTFTRKAAGELQGRLRELGADGVRARTFHGAALAQLSHFWPQFVGGDAPQLLPGKVAAISQTVESLGMRLSGETLRDIAAEIEWRKVSMLSLDTYAQQLDQRPALAGVTPEKLIDIQERYTKLLEERRQIDFEDVLVLLSGMLEVEPRAALQVREQYRFFTVDEFQDVSPLQRHVLKLWLGARDDLCVVGDASQTIYSFAGASSSFLLRFGAEYPNAREFRLERNYRSTPPIVVSANRLMREKPGALQLSPMREGGDVVPQFEWFQTEQDEARAVAQAIAQARTRGVPASDIAVLYRTNAQSARIEEALTSQGVPTRVHGAQRFYDRADVRRAILLIRGQAKAGDDRPLFQVVSDMLRVVGWSAKPPEGAAERERWEALNSILSLADEMPPGTTIVQFSEELLARQRAQHEPKMEAVTLSAVHASKGLEWPHVHVVGLSEGIFPISHAQSEHDIEEERRLAYVAFTRARDTLLLSGFASAARVARQPSRFVGEAGVRP